MYTFYSASLNRVRELSQPEADQLNAAGGDWVIVPAPPPFNPATHNQPQFSNGAWVSVPKTADELAAIAAAAADAEETRQLRLVVAALKAGTGTAGERITRLERVCVHLIKTLFS